MQASIFILIFFFFFVNYLIVKYLIVKYLIVKQKENWLGVFLLCNYQKLILIQKLSLLK
jgi:hypothetical protein